MLVYERFHATLAKEFLEASFFVYVDDIAVVTKNTNDMHRVLEMVQELSLILGFQTNQGKTEIRNGPQPPWSRQKRLVPQPQGPILVGTRPPRGGRPPPPLYRPSSTGTSGVR